MVLLEPAAKMDMMASALVVIDTQNDFCSPEGVCAGNGDDVSRVKGAISHLENAVIRARKNRMEVIWIQYIGDDKYKTPNLRERDYKQEINSKCLENTWGAEFYQVIPNENEKIFQKYACFDAFMNNEFGNYLKQRDTDRLILAGVYTDICLDSTARTGFQRGYRISALEDCTESLHYGKEDVLEFMKKFYDAEIATSRDFIS